MTGDVDRGAWLYGLRNGAVEEGEFRALLDRLAWLTKDLGGGPWRSAPAKDVDRLRADVFFLAPNRTGAPEVVYVTRGVTLELAELLVKVQNNLPELLRRAALFRPRAAPPVNAREGGIDVV